MDLGFKGKVALVTGAGSQVGFGKATALLHNLPWMRLVPVFV